MSQSTVSRALRDSRLVSEDTRKRVAEAASKLNYKVDVNARNLRSRSSRTLALLLCEDPGAGDSLINPFFLAMVGSITKAAGARGYDVLISFQQSSGDWYADYADSKRADGFVFLGYGDYLGYVEKIARLEEAEAPFITWGPVIEGQPGHFLGSDNVGGAREAVAHLIGLGRRRIACLGDATEHFPEFRQRHQGWLNAHRDAGLTADPALRVQAVNSEESGRAAALQLLDTGARFDAIFAASDLIAFGAMRALQERGLDVPRDVAVVGFDDLHAAAWTNPPLTTVRQDTVTAGALLVEQILRLIRGEPAEPRLVPTRLVVRGSCGADHRRAAPAE